MFKILRGFVIKWFLSNIDKVKDDLAESFDKEMAKADSIIVKAQDKYSADINKAEDALRLSTQSAVVKMLDKKDTAYKVEAKAKAAGKAAVALSNIIN